MALVCEPPSHRTGCRTLIERRKSEMKTTPFSLCIGLALLGSIACGTSVNPIGTGTVGAIGGFNQTSSTGGSNGTTYNNGGTGSGEIRVPDSSGGSAPSGTAQCAPGNTTTISGV